jgi:pimeloyl-ACP methyl ester carboxylesterase
MIEKEILIHPSTTGTLAIPDSEGIYPAVLLLAGSGPLDRDGNDRKGKYQTNLYKELAHFITGLGFVTLRYDKRGTGKRDDDWMAAGLSDLADDAKTAMLFLREHPNIDSEKVIVCGHSEGTILATILAETMNPAGCMFLSGGVDNVMEALHHQRQLAYKELLAQPGWKGWINRTLKVDIKNEKQYVKLLEKMKRSERDTIKILLFFKQPAKWFREHDAYDTQRALENVTCPVFALHGDKDPLLESHVLQELDGLVQGKSEYHIIHNMEHGLRVQIEPRSVLNLKKIFKEILKRPLHEEGLEKIAAWLIHNFKTGHSQEQ